MVGVAGDLGLACLGRVFGPSGGPFSSGGDIFGLFASAERSTVFGAEKAVRGPKCRRCRVLMGQSWLPGEAAEP